MLPVEFMLVIMFLALSQDAINQSKDHIDQITLVAENFGGRCTDENTKYDFSIDYNAYSQARNIAIDNVMLPYIILPFYCV